jgi:hypothetical protein
MHRIVVGRLLLATRIIWQNLMVILERDNRTRVTQDASFVHRSEQRAVFGCGTPAEIVGGSRNGRSTQLPPASFTVLRGAVDGEGTVEDRSAEPFGKR